MSKRIHRVFVYGTLKRGQYFHNKYLADRSNYIGPAKASLDFSLYIDGLPHLIREPTDKHVKGELYEVDEEVLMSLDDLEGHPIVYKREIIEVLVPAGTQGESDDAKEEKKLAWAYLRGVHFKGKLAAYKDQEFT